MLPFHDELVIRENPVCFLISKNFILQKFLRIRYNINNNNMNEAVRVTDYYRRSKLLNIKVATVSDVI